MISLRPAAEVKGYVTLPAGLLTRGMTCTRLPTLLGQWQIGCIAPLTVAGAVAEFGAKPHHRIPVSPSLSQHHPAKWISVWRKMMMRKQELGTESKSYQS